MVSYRDVLKLAHCEGIKTTVRRRKLLRAGNVVCSDIMRFNRQVLFETVERPPPVGTGDGGGRAHEQEKQ